MKNFWKKLKKKAIEKAIELLILGLVAFLTLMVSLLYDKAKQSVTTVIQQEVQLQTKQLERNQKILIDSAMNKLAVSDSKINYLIYRDSISFIKMRKIEIAIERIKLPEKIEVDNTDYNKDLNKLLLKIDKMRNTEDSINVDFAKQKKRILEEYERQLNSLLRQLPK